MKCVDCIIKELDNKIFQFNFEGKTTDKACFNKIKIDYLLLLTLAACWDIKSEQLNEEDKKAFLSALQRPQTGDLIRLIDSVLKIDKSIVSIFDMYKEGRNSLFGHTTFDEYEAQRLNKECELCWELLINLTSLKDKDSDLIRNFYQDENDFYYIANIKESGDMLVKQFGIKTEFKEFPLVMMKSRLLNKSNTITKGDLFLLVNNTYIKISPFIQYNDAEELFMLIMDIESDPLQFKMAYVFRTNYANDSVKYLDEFPVELKMFFPEDDKKITQNGVTINRFSQFNLFKQEYYKDINTDTLVQLNNFITGNMAYGAIRGVGGVGKTSLVFMWLNSILTNENHILEGIREKFNLKRIIFLSAKTKIYSRDINAINLSNFYELSSDIKDYNTFIESIYSLLHHKVKSNTQFIDKVNYLKNYNISTNGLLIIIDDYESLPLESREQIQILKDFLDPKSIKLLITTRFISKESKDIVVSALNMQDCAKMADYIFCTNKWRQDLTIQEFHDLTSGLPLLIWYAKAHYNMGQLTTKKLKEKFTGPEEGLDYYLYNNFEECFESDFTKNFLMLTSRYYELHHVLQISKKTIIFLCLENPQNYKQEDEEFYLKELIDLKLISINKTTNSIDFSPLMTYINKSSCKPQPVKLCQEDALKALVHLNEERHKDLYGIIYSSKYLEDSAKLRLLKRLITFSYDDSEIRNLAINSIFTLTEDKLTLYKENECIFLNDLNLMQSLIEHLNNNINIDINNYTTIIDCIKSLSIKLYQYTDIAQKEFNLLNIIYNLLDFILKQRENEEITNSELTIQAQLLICIAKDIKNIETQHDEIEKIRNIIESISIYCDIDKI